MGYLALYREWRPQTFADVVGQGHVTRTLKNALKSNKLAHAYLLSGPRGTGKTTIAKLIAKAVNCERPQAGEPCNECSACREITTGSAVDVLEIDAASNTGVDNVRDLRDKIQYLPAQLKYKVYIIDEVHMLSAAAFNALLKTLEEPPGHAVFVLATTEAHKIPATIVSRCQRFDFHRLSYNDIVGRLQEVCEKHGLQAEPEALSLIARRADGGMRDGLSLLDQAAAYSQGGAITLEGTLTVLGSAPLDQYLGVSAALAAGDAAQVLRLVDAAVRSGKDLKQYVRDLLSHFRDLLLLRVGGDDGLLEAAPSDLPRLRQQAAAWSRDGLAAAVKHLAGLEADMRFAAQPRLLLEVALLQLAAPARPVEEAPAPPPPPRPEPVSAPAPAPEPPAQPGEWSLQAVRDAWARILDNVKRESRLAEALLKEGRPHQLQGKRLFIGFQHRAHSEKLANSHQAIVERALERAGFPGMQVATAVVEPGQEPAPEAPRKEEKGVDELTAKVLKIFGGEIVDVKEDESR